MDVDAAGDRPQCGPGIAVDSGLSQREVRLARRRRADHRKVVKFRGVQRRDRFQLPRVFMRSRKFRDFALRSEEHTSELQSLMRTSYAVFCLKKKNDPMDETIINTQAKTTGTT